MHNWGDKDVDWDGIWEAARYIGTYCRRWGRLGGDYKEKFGTVRFYAHFGWLSLHTLIYPGYVSSQFPKWLWCLDCRVIGPVLRKLFERPFRWWQTKVYARAYWNALYRWPHLRAEILLCADYLELIPGVTCTNGNVTHVLDWDGKSVGSWEHLG